MCTLIVGATLLSKIEIGAVLRKPAATFALAACLAFRPLAIPAHSFQEQAVESQSKVALGATLQGTVQDADNSPVVGAAVLLEAKDGQAAPAPITAVTDAAGAYHFSAVPHGVYSLLARRTGYNDSVSQSITLQPEESKTINLQLESATAAAARNSPGNLPEFFDQPRFTVAGVTDTTGAGGHGSDAVQRNREALAQATASLTKTPTVPVSAANSAATEKALRKAVEDQPESVSANGQFGRLLREEGRGKEALPYLEKVSRLSPADGDNSYALAQAHADNGDFERARAIVQALLSTSAKTHPDNSGPHHLLADLDEKLGDPLEAVREYERAAELDPSESHLFDWGAELLLHRASEPAVEVFTKGNRLFPRSVRMLTGLGASWYAVGSYEQAARRLCEASDLNPDDPNPYLFMGKMQMVESTQSEAIVERLGRFVKLQPKNPMANYYYAASLWKHAKYSSSADVVPIQLLLEEAVRLDPKLGLAFVQLGILYAERDDFPRAIAAYQHAIEVSPKLEEAHYHLAQAYRESGEISKARTELQIYSQVSKERADETERERHELQQFVYELRNQSPAPTPR
jgi:tetratricopeptide (TPR) repeat protein